MSFAAGSLAGALVMGGIYHGFSNLMQTRTAQHRADIHTLSERLVSASTTIPSPPPASTRITYHPLTSLIQSKWNNEVAGLFGTVCQWEQRAVELGKKVLYGGDS
ncbi:uncharacterized protein EDB91DRAFT_1053180 [Suillus paluster]|uniref:uncharacterized protein n=1 Tax=Suillus paluster TaxID=48578 RepID=UPI001B85F115|nr:uncharacterized protein EDB91DRAFT_1053180 [Suillus paluster]KAG1740399.1 hypothetical protein EDB91DRAFT_1053180 [Suillus paluster]